MSFNHYPTNQAQEVICSLKTLKADRQLLFFNENLVVQTKIQKRQGMFLDTELNFLHHFI